MTRSMRGQQKPVRTLWRKENISCPCRELNPWVVQPLAFHYIVYAKRTNEGAKTTEDTNKVSYWSL